MATPQATLTALHIRVAARAARLDREEVDPYTPNHSEQLQQIHRSACYRKIGDVDRSRIWVQRLQTPAQLCVLRCSCSIYEVSAKLAREGPPTGIKDTNAHRKQAVPAWQTLRRGIQRAIPRIRTRPVDDPRNAGICRDTRRSDRKGRAPPANHLRGSD